MSKMLATAGMGNSYKAPKPIAIRVVDNSIPAELKALCQWVTWKYEFKMEKSKQWTKVPYNPNTRIKASHSDQNSWGTFENAYTLYLQGGYDGIGFVFSENDPYWGIDLDGCRNPETGEIDPQKKKFIDQFDSYTEVSPSSTGLHIIIEGQLPGGGRKDEKLGIEIYDRQRFFCFTGHKFDGMPTDPQPRQDEFDWFYNEIFGPKKKQTGFSFKPDASVLTAYEQKILKKAFANKKTGDKIRLLCEGNFEEAGYPSQSEADLALCNHLAFWFDRDPVVIDKVFRTSNLYRPKWDKKHYTNGDTYGQHTIRKAVENVQEGYSGNINKTTAPTSGFDGEPVDIFGEPSLTGRPAWPMGACPKGIELFAIDEAERIGVEIAMVALPAIGIAAMAISDQFKIQPKRKDPSWTEDPRLWLAVVADPGQKKTPALNSAKRPLVRAAIKLHEEHEAAMDQYKEAFDDWEHNGKRGPRPQKPIERRLYVDDITVEALRRVLMENTIGIGIIKDELSGWLASFDAYRSAASRIGSKDRADYCELYQGGPKSFDRAEKGFMFVPHWGASIVGGIQPGPVKRMMGNITDDGLIARFLVAHCERSDNGSERAEELQAFSQQPQTAVLHDEYTLRRQLGERGEIQA